MKQYTQAILGLLNEELEWFTQNFKEIGLIFAKLLRMVSFTLASDNPSFKVILKLVFAIWQSRKDGRLYLFWTQSIDCIRLGRELIRLMMDVFKSKVVAI